MRVTIAVSLVLFSSCIDWKEAACIAKGQCGGADASVELEVDSGSGIDDAGVFLDSGESDAGRITFEALCPAQG